MAFGRIVVSRSHAERKVAHRLRNWQRSWGSVFAGLTELIDISLGLPGHAILLSVLPLALGLAIVPRSMAGSIMGLGALATSGVIRSFGGGGGLGAFTSLCLLGPCLDVALLRARSGPWIYGGLALGAVAANMAAFGVQLAIKLLASGGGRGGGGGGGGGMGGGRSLMDWLPQAIVTYPLFGLVAGLVSAAIWFRFRERPTTPRSHG